MQKKFLITEAVPHSFIDGLTNLGFQCDVYPNIQKDDILNIISSYNGLFIRGRVIADAELIDKATNLQYILRPGSGLDIIDQNKAKKRNIQLINSPEGNRDAVAEHALGLLLSLLNHIPRAFNDLKNFNWTRKVSAGNELMNKTIGIIGFGNTGSAFAKRLQGFDVKVLAFDKFKSNFGNKYIKEVSEETIFENADIVSFHIPLNAANKYLVCKNYLNKFSKEFYLINTSRGQILKTEDLLQLIKSGKIKGACLDVLKNENLGSYDELEKLCFSELINSGKVIITPHIAGKTLESEEKIHKYLLEKLENVLKN